MRTYVYRLIDPRNGETFYVGKGKGDRVFAHIPEQVEEGDPSRIGFVGSEAPEGLRAQYVGKRVPEEYRKRGAANPVRYT